MNRVILIGNLTRDPEMTLARGGELDICNFSIAVQRRFFKEKGVNDVDFFNVTAFGKTAKNCGTYLRRGSKACVIGSVEIDNYVGNDGVKRVAVKVTADEVEFLSTKPSDASNANPVKESGRDFMLEIDETVDDAPF